MLNCMATVIIMIKYCYVTTVIKAEKWRKIATAAQCLATVVAAVVVVVFVAGTAAAIWMPYHGSAYGCCFPVDTVAFACFFSLILN